MIVGPHGGQGGPYPTDVSTSIGNGGSQFFSFVPTKLVNAQGAGRVKRENKSPGYSLCEMQAYSTFLFLNKNTHCPQETLVGSWGESNF